MKTLFKLVLPMLALLCMSLQAGEIKWLDDFGKAKELAAESKRPILMLFSGSDWCPWCIKLEEEVLSVKEVKDFIGANTVPMLVDYPREKRLQPGVARQNEKLGAMYNEERGLPSVFLVDKDGKKLGQVDFYEDFTPKGFMAALKEALEKGKSVK
jgi:thioredoxin-related protein